MYNVAVWRVRVTTDAVVKKYYECVCVCLCSCSSFPKCKSNLSHASYYIVICELSGCTVFFPHYLINGTIFGYIYIYIYIYIYMWKTKWVFWFSPKLLSATLSILRKIRQDTVGNVYRLSRKVPVNIGDTRWRSWLRHCAASWKVAGSIPDGVIGFFSLTWPWGRLSL